MIYHRQTTFEAQQFNIIQVYLTKTSPNRNGHRGQWNVDQHRMPFCYKMFFHVPEELVKFSLQNEPPDCSRFHVGKPAFCYEVNSQSHRDKSCPKSTSEYKNRVKKCLYMSQFFPWLVTLEIQVGNSVYVYSVITFGLPHLKGMWPWLAARACNVAGPHE